MNVDFPAQNFGTNNGVLNKVLGDSATNHEQAGRARLQLDVGEFSEITNRIHRQILFGIVFLMQHQTKPS